jgi:hypothetical protein
VGILVIGSASGAYTAAGMKDPTTTSGTDTFKSLVRHFNKQGGVAGRMIQPVYVETDAQGDFEAQQQAACATFTEDHDVAIVLSQAMYSDAFAGCLTKAQTPLLDAQGNWPPDAVSLQQNPGYFLVNHPTIDRRLQAMAQASLNTGWLSPTSKLGLVVSDCPQVRRATSRSLMPFLERNNIRVAERVDIGCVTSFSAIAPISSQASSAILRFRSAGVDKVLFAADYEAIPVLLFAHQAEAAKFYPGYVLSSDASVATMQSNYPRPQLANMRGGGWSPTLDVAATGFASAATERCRSVLRGEGVVPQTPADYVTVDTICDTFFLLEHVLRTSRGRMSFPVAQEAINGLGTGYLSTFTIAGSTDFNAQHHDGASQFRPFAYDGGCSCFKYVGPPFTRP